MSESLPKTAITRRNFAVRTAVAATAALLPMGKAQAQSTTTQTEAEAMKKLSPGARAEVEMKVSEIFRKYGRHLNDEQKADIRKVMAETQDGLEKMRSFALSNGDQPATALQLYGPGGEK